MITPEESACRNIEVGHDVAGSLATIRAYVAQEAMREAAVAWIESTLAVKALVDRRAFFQSYVAALQAEHAAKEAYLTLRAAGPTETEKKS